MVLYRLSIFFNLGRLSNRPPNVISGLEILAEFSVYKCFSVQMNESYYVYEM